MSVEAAQYYHDLSSLSGVPIPPILTGVPQNVGGVSIELPVHSLPLPRLRERRAALREDVLDHLRSTGEFLRGLLTYMYPDTEQTPVVDDYYFRLAASRIFDMKLPKNVRTGRLKQLRLEAITFGEVEDAVRPGVTPHPDKDTAPLEAAVLLATATYTSGQTSGEVGNVVRVDVEGQKYENGLPASFQQLPSLSIFPVKLDRNKIAKEVRNIQRSGVVVDASHRSRYRPIPSRLPRDT